MSEKSKNNEGSEFPKFYTIIIDGNQTERGKKLRAKMEKLGYDEESIENHVQVDHVLSFVDGENIFYQSYFEFKFIQVQMFVNCLMNQNVPLNNIIDYLERLQKINLQRAGKFITDEDIIKEKISPEHIVLEEDIKLFNRNIKVEIKYLKKKFKKGIVKSGKNTKKLVWLGDREQLELLFNLWKSEDFINYETQMNDFLSNFKDKSWNDYVNSEQITINWIAKQNELAYSISELISPSINLLASKDIWKITTFIFGKNTGEKFKSLAVLSQKMPKNNEILEQIIKKVKKC